MGKVIDYEDVKLRRVRALEKELQALYAESREITRLGAVNAGKQRKLYDELVRLGAREPVFTGGKKK